MTVSLLHPSHLFFQLWHLSRTKATLKNYIAVMTTDFSVHRCRCFDYSPLFWFIWPSRLLRYLLILGLNLSVEIGCESLSRNSKGESSVRISCMLASRRKVEIMISDQARSWFSVRRTLLYQRVWPFLDYPKDFEWILFENSRRRHSNLWVNE